MDFILTNAPHQRRQRTTFHIMLELTAAIGVLALVSVIYNFIANGPKSGVMALVIIAVSVLVSMLCDGLFFCRTLTPRRVGDAVVKPSFKVWLSEIGHSYSYVTGLLLGLMFPVGTAIYTVVVSAVIATLVAKLLFGGFGHNVFNPAIVGRIFAQVCMPSTIKSVVEGTAETVETGATLNSYLQSQHWLTMDFGGLSIPDMLLGKYQGGLGETFGIVIIVLGIYLAVRGIIDARISLTYVLAVFIGCLVMALTAGLGSDSFEWAFRQLLVGGLLFGAVFCLTDPVTSPTAPMGKIIYSLLAALVTMAIRFQASAPEGVGFSILIVNICTPAIDRLLKGKTNERFEVTGTASGVVFACLVIFAVVFGLNNKPVTKNPEPATAVLKVTAPATTELPADLYLEGGVQR